MRLYTAGLEFLKMSMCKGGKSKFSLIGRKIEKYFHYLQVKGVHFGMSNLYAVLICSSVIFATSTVSDQAHALFDSRSFFFGGILEFTVPPKMV